MKPAFLLLLLLAVPAAPSSAAAMPASRPVWVFFADRATAGVALDGALDQAAARLPAAVLARRVRAGAPAVTPGDLDLAPAHLAAAAATGARLRHASRWLNAASFDATPVQEQRLRALPGVVRVQPVARGRAPEPIGTRPLSLATAPDKSTSGELDYGFNLPGMVQANVLPAHAAGLTGRGVTVGLLDSGFDTAHEAFRGLPVLAAWDFVNNDPVVADEPGDPVGSEYHGTMVLSTLAARRTGHLLGPAPGVSVILAKTEDVSQEIPLEEDHWVAGLEWLEAQGADIVTSSLVYIDWYDYANLDGATAVTTVAADLAVARGLIVINAAGNSRTTTGSICVPADGDSVIAVGAVTAGGATTWFSSPGPTADGRIKPDVAALGQDNPVADPGDPFGYVEASGTSFATPLTAGVAALVLERAPGLTPMQMRDALRETAGQADHPDNDQGWGIIDAWRAATWWGPVFAHTPLRDTEDTAGPYGPGGQITAVHGLDDASLAVVWRVGSGPWQSAPLMPTGGGPVSYFADIPGQPAGSRVEYYLTGADLAGVTVTDPVRAPGRVHAFTVGPDATPPRLAHAPLDGATLFAWPPMVRCTATDNLGLEGVELAWQLNGGPVQGPAALVAGVDDTWALALPLAASGVVPGDVITYTLTARDLAAAANTALSGPHAFAVQAVAQGDTVLAEAPALFIPDGASAGLVRALVFAAGATPTILGVEVGIDITAADPEQLRITLYPPDGAPVVLHDHGGAGTSDLTGVWPVDLAVAGPGSLDDLVTRSADGAWVLEVVDDVVGSYAVLQSWSLRLTLSPAVSAVGDTPSALMAGPLAAAPNPFNPRTVLSFALARPARAVLSIHDIRGMLVRRVLDADLPAGPQQVQWDGCDARGRTVASGVYVARLEAGGATCEHKLTLVR